MPEILCLHCGTLNAADQETCSFCRQPLPVVKEEGEGIHPEDGSAGSSTSGDFLTHEPPRNEADSPDLLAGLEHLSRQEQEDEIPGWLGGEPSDASFSEGTFTPTGTDELTDWLDKLGTDEQAPVPAPDAAADESLDDWLSALPPVASAPPGSTGVEIGTEADLPDWMKSSSEPIVPGEAAVPESSLPDWLASFRESAPSGQESRFTPPADELPAAPAFEFDSFSGEGDKDLFPAETPEWLSKITPTQEKTGDAGAVGKSSNESIVPSDIPSWVRAMRPVESVLPEEAFPMPEGMVEEKGPLAGLRGVLPLAGGFIPSGRSVAQAIRLQVSDAQLGDSALLEKMLVAEKESKPIRGSAVMASDKILRWVLSSLMIILISTLLVTGLQSVPLPTSLPAETSLILPVLDSLPQNAPVLLIVDYEPALAGELETAAAPFIDHLIGQRRPRLTILSTSPVGSALAERFLADTQSQHSYRLNQDYINLGYLPGDALGIASFAENPRLALPFTSWNQPPAQDVRQLSDFAAIVLLTDQAGTARAWIEQTDARRAGVPLLVVSSAQAAPMIQPYLLSGQVNGMLSGVQGGAAFLGLEGHRSLRGSWDAFNYASLLAALLMMFGGLWNLIAGVLARRRTPGEV